LGRCYFLEHRFSFALPHCVPLVILCHFNIIVGYEVYLKRADRSGLLDGWKVWTEGSGETMLAKIIIHRTDRKHAFEHEVEMAEYHQGNAMWKRKGKTMLKKVATAQGFRLCFPSEIAGLPYIAEEVEDGMEIHMDSGPIETTTTENARAADADDKAIDKIQDLLAKVDGNTAKAYTARLDATDWKITQQQAEEAIGKLTIAARKNQKAGTAKQKEAENPGPMTMGQRAAKIKQMHTIGTALNGDNWDQVREVMIQEINPEKSSSKELDPAELITLVNTLIKQERQAQQ